jgi:hypothetical protein
MSVPVIPGYLDSSDSTERKEDRTQNRVIRDPGDGCAEDRQAHKQNKVVRLGVHSASDLKGAATRLPLPCARVDGLEPPLLRPRRRTAGHLSGSDRATRCPTEGVAAREATLVGQGRLSVSTSW